jgi:hypothetical protein
VLATSSSALAAEGVLLHNVGVRWNSDSWLSYDSDGRLSEGSRRSRCSLIRYVAVLLTSMKYPASIPAGGGKVLSKPQLWLRRRMLNVHDSQFSYRAFAACILKGTRRFLCRLPQANLNASFRLLKSALDAPVFWRTSEWWRATDICRFVCSALVLGLGFTDAHAENISPTTSLNKRNIGEQETLPTARWRTVQNIGAQAIDPGSTDASPPASAGTAISSERICQTIELAAHENELPVEFLTHLIWQESRFNPRAVSPAGAQGVAQFMPTTAAWRGLENPFDPVPAILKSAELLRDLMKQFRNLGFAAAAYNAGSKRVQDWLAGRASLPSETQAYVRIITGHSVDEWRVTTLIPLNPTSPERVPCPQVANVIPRDNVRSAVTPQKQELAWGVQLVGSGSEANALAEYRQMQKKYVSVLGAHEPLVIRTNLGKSSSWYRVRVGATTRASAEKLCLTLRASGGNCLVQRN